MLTDAVLIAGAALTALFCLNPRLITRRSWRATVTPLASIIGSGFLIVGPILADTAGRHAWLAMAGLCGLGYLYGSAIRQNIVRIEPRLGRLSGLPAMIERASDLMLSLSYFVSVAYYLNLFAAFGLRIVGETSPHAVNLTASIVIALLGIAGFFGGLRALERLEIGTVGIKLSVIGGLLAALAVAFALAKAEHAPPPSFQHLPTSDALRVVLGLVILVQGFETSRYLGEEYDPATRVRTMRRAQWLSSAIYISFVFLLTHLFPDGIRSTASETQIIDMLRPLGAAVAPMLILAALASQSSAAVADMNGAGGLLYEVSRKRLPVRIGNLATAAAAIAITWSANIFEIVTYASKAFVAYYALQSLQALLGAAAERQRLRTIAYGAGAAIALVVIVWAVPASA